MNRRIKWTVEPLLGFRGPFCNMEYISLVLNRLFARELGENFIEFCLPVTFKPHGKAWG